MAYDGMIAETISIIGDKNRPISAYAGAGRVEKGVCVLPEVPVRITLSCAHRSLRRSARAVPARAWTGGSI